MNAISFRVIATAGNFSDGKENMVPVLTNRILVTESLPLTVRGNETKTFQLEKLIESTQSNTLQHNRLTFNIP